MFARVSLVALLGLVGALVGCSDDEAARDTTSATTVSVETTVPLTPEQLDAMLLDASDVGAAWQLGPAVTDADLADASQIPCPDTAIDPGVTDRLTPVTGVQFEPVDHSSKHLIEFAVTGQPEQLDGDLQVLFDSMDACAATTPTTIGTGSLTVDPLTIPELGDQRAAYTLIGVESPDETWYIRNAEVRVGAIAVEVGLTEILQPPDNEPSISDAEFIQLIQTAVAKLARWVWPRTGQPGVGVLRRAGRSGRHRRRGRRSGRLLRTPGRTQDRGMGVLPLPNLYQRAVNQHRRPAGPPDRCGWIRACSSGSDDQPAITPGGCGRDGEIRTPGLLLPKQAR